MSILFAALDQAARSHRAAHGVADTTFPPAFIIRRRPAHMPWWLALVGGLGIGLSSINLWTDGVSTSPPMPNNMAMEQPGPVVKHLPAPVVPIRHDDTDTLIPQRHRPALAAPDIDADASTEPDNHNVPGLSIRAEQGSTPTQQTLTRAQSAARAGDFAAAVIGYNEVLAHDPGNRDALSGKAFALQQNGAPTEAAVIWARLYQSDPEDQTALANVAATLASVDDAVSHDQLAQLQASHPKSAALYAATAQARVKQGDLNGAQGDLERAWALDRDNPITRLNLAIVADRRGDSAAALKLYRQVLADPVAAETLLPMSWTAIETRADYLAQRTAP